MNSDLGNENSKIHPVSSVGAKLKLGWIPYWNLWPFMCELNRLNYGTVEISKGDPSKINSLLERGDITLAPCSSICLVSKPNLEMALPLGVASDGPVLSVYLGFYKEHAPLLELLKERRQTLKVICRDAIKKFGYDTRSISKYLYKESQKLKPIPLEYVPGLDVTPHSASSTVLTKILYQLWFGIDAYKLMVGRDVSQKVYTRRPVKLLIGDEALQKSKQFYSVLDLGLIWKELTGLPFVFAVWQSKGACLNGWRRKILEVGKVAQNRMRVEPSVYIKNKQPVDDTGAFIPLPEYWNSIYYCLGPRELRGLLLFLCLARTFKLVPIYDEVMGKILRWEALSQLPSLPDF